jgi:bifunctional DNase/RNase
MEVAGVHVEQDSNIPVVLLRELVSPHRILAIHIGGPEAAAIAMSLTGHVPPRPLAHDVMAALVDRLDATVDAVEVVDVRNGTFIAHLLLRGPHGQEHLDSRASDAIALAMRVGAPVLVAESVLVAVGAVPEPFALSFDDERLDDELDDRVDDGPGGIDPHGEPPHGEPRPSVSTSIAADPEQIDREIDAFRSFLDGLEPSDFGR